MIVLPAWILSSFWAPASWSSSVLLVSQSWSPLLPVNPMCQSPSSSWTSMALSLFLDLPLPLKAGPTHPWRVSPPREPPHNCQTGAHFARASKFWIPTLPQNFPPHPQCFSLGKKVELRFVFCFISAFLFPVSVVAFQHLLLCVLKAIKYTKERMVRKKL